MDSFELTHSKEILEAYFRWASSWSCSGDSGHCSSIEWKYDNGSAMPSGLKINRRFHDEAMTISNVVFGLMFKDLPRQQKLLKAHFKTLKHERMTSRELGIHYSCYNVELNRAQLCFYNRLKRYCGDDKFARLFII